MGKPLPGYRLQSLLELREHKKEAAERYLGECLQALKTEQDRLKEMEEELKRMVANREAKIKEYAEKAMRGEMIARSAISSNLFIERMKEMEETQKEAINGQKDVVLQKEKEVEGARKDLLLATQELKALEKHREKWEEERKKEIAAKQEEAMDETAQNLYLRQR